MSGLAAVDAGIDTLGKANEFAQGVLDTVGKGSQVALSVTKDGIQMKHIVEDEATRDQNVKAIKEHTVAYTMNKLRTKFENDYNIIVCNDYTDDKKTFTGETQALKLITVAFGGRSNDISHYRIYLFRGGKYERGAAGIGQPGHRWEDDGIQYYGVGGKPVQKDEPIGWMVLQFPEATGEAWSREQVEEAAVEIGLSTSVEPNEEAPRDEDAAKTADEPDAFDPVEGGGQQDAPQEGDDGQQEARAGEGDDQGQAPQEGNEGNDQPEAQGGEGEGQGEAPQQGDEGEAQTEPQNETQEAAEPGEPQQEGEGEDEGKGKAEGEE
ncbi:hypothetical protein BKA64DRAFT_742618 [Cadophora sp. MPI-SDFR-AT-0126]|nr:hypothetical protein BKA64DRAFT_742618 [Leotiomycetes sp. MPI-SDFR-AT-0126]